MNHPETINATPSALNRYGRSIQLVDEGSPLAGQSLNINGNPAIGGNPDRYKQHGFYFSADHCIACHACESACSEKNELPAHIAFRSVGYVEGGTWPDYHRLNLSMACNHCDDPVCLKGCPTRAYTKFAEYGAVLQDPDICFGCGYCTWVCPYNAPQLDPVKGQVEKCNMCVDRLEQGLKPACAAACLAGALDFGVIETTPANRTQSLTQIPGFPDPAITHPNIRFQQTKNLPREMTRPDSMPLRYLRDEQSTDKFHTRVRETGKARAWNLKKLRSREDPLVVFTLVSQGVVGAFLALFLGPLFGLDVLAPQRFPLAHALILFALLGLQTFALALSTLHLGKPRRFYRAFYNLRHSPVSREIAGMAVFYATFGAYTVLTVFPALVTWLLPAAVVETMRTGFGWAAVLAGPAMLYFMYRIYRIPARPFWNHWWVATSFYGSMLTLGAFSIGLVYATLLAVQGTSYAELMTVLLIPVVAGLVLEGTGLVFHARAMQRQNSEGAASHYEQRTTFGKTYWLRNGLLTASVLTVIGAVLSGLNGWVGLAGWVVAALLAFGAAIIGRALFYALVIPTTLPGAFFWRNRGFREHARETGLARLPQVGVVPDAA
ncbi:MAG TPA: DmsC/YnfH family molybdoenzyme membrane anchor subunit [Burkholderiales bacterium]|nr:DmsC/YnfH family molybdoenzyme membrane anchor subunit [Burkholderiales bacterium]